MSRSRRFFWFALVWTLLIVIGLTLPGHSLPSGSLLEYDKAIHLGLFFVLTVLWLEALANGRVHRALIILGSIIAFSFLSEVYQQLLPFDRTADLFDAVADSIGATLGLVAWAISHAIWPKKAV